MNLLSAPLFSTNAGQFTLPGLLAAMARHEVHSFGALRPHQRPAWHMFLVQLAALALSRTDLDGLPDGEEAWGSLLFSLTSGSETAWSLVAPDDKPAFLQPAVPQGVQPSSDWATVGAPDMLDMLITARNHDLKQSVARHARPEDWIFALISLQTMEGYGGAGNCGIVRMNGGSSSRPLLGLAPALPHGGGPDASAWWGHDVTRLLALRQEGKGLEYGTAGGAALLWMLPWPEGRQLALADLDPWFIEVCRRIRLNLDGNKLIARRATSAKARIAADGVNGVTGDPWAPVTMDRSPKSLTLAGGDFDYARLCDLLFSGSWHRPLLAQPGPDEGDLLLVAEAFSRGNSKTEGFKSRIVPVPGAVRRLLAPADAGHLAKEQMDEISVFDAALRNGLALVASGGDREKLGKDHYARSGSARNRFDRAADAEFFPALWRRLAASPEDRPNVSANFIKFLFDTAEVIFDAELPFIRCPSILRPRAEARARQAFRSTVRRGHGGGRDFSFLFTQMETTDEVV